MEEKRIIIGGEEEIKKAKEKEFKKLLEKYLPEILDKMIVSGKLFVDKEHDLRVF